MNFLLDTCVLSEARRPRPNRGVASWLERTPESRLLISVMVLGEIRKGIAKLGNDERAQALREWLEEDLGRRFGERVLGVDDETALIWGRLSGEGEAKGNPLPVIDSLLAATAIRHNLKLVTRNVADFERFPIELLNPWTAEK